MYALLPYHISHNKDYIFHIKLISFSFSEWPINANIQEKLTEKSFLRLSKLNARSLRSVVHSLNLISCNLWLCGTFSFLLQNPASDSFWFILFIKLRWIVFFSLIWLQILLAIYFQSIIKPYYDILQ